jgi:hypothetical protein
VAERLKAPVLKVALVPARKRQPRHPHRIVLDVASTLALCTLSMKNQGDEHMAGKIRYGGLFVASVCGLALLCTEQSWAGSGGPGWANRL